MKKFLKISFILFSVVLLCFIVVAVALNNVSANANNKNSNVSDKEKTEVNSGIVLGISEDQNASVSYDFSFDSINKDNSFNNAEMDVTYRESNKNGSSTSVTEKYYTQR